MSTNNTLPGKPYYVCTEISEFCSVHFTTLGYYPNLGANAFFLAGFAVCFLASVGVGIWKRTWTFMAALAAGSILEAAGTWILGLWMSLSGDGTPKPCSSTPGPHLYRSED